MRAEEETNALLHTPPCLRTALLWGIGVGLAVGVHRFRMVKSVRSACDFAVGGFAGVSLTSWFLCSNAYRHRMRATREFMEAMNDPTRKLEAEQFLRSRVQVAADGSDPVDTSARPATS